MLQNYISTFCKPVMKTKYGIPIEVGAFGREKFIYPLHDDTGDNISSENAYYGELTGMYWVWKNTKQDEDCLIGFSHYNKQLRITEKMLKNCTEKNLWIAAKPVKIKAHSIQKETDALRIILEKNYPDYYETWKLLYNEDGSGKFNSCMFANMFVTGRKEFEAYCEFLFGILQKLRIAVGEGSEERYYKRYCAFLGERLLSVYLETNRKTVLTVPVKYSQEYMSLLIKAVHILKIDKIPLLKNALSNHMRYKSLYRDDK